MNCAKYFALNYIYTSSYSKNGYWGYFGCCHSFSHCYLLFSPSVTYFCQSLLLLSSHCYLLVKSPLPTAVTTVSYFCQSLFPISVSYSYTLLLVTQLWKWKKKKKLCFVDCRDLSKHITSVPHKITLLLLPPCNVVLLQCCY